MHNADGLPIDDEHYGKGANLPAAMAESTTARTTRVLQAGNFLPVKFKVDKDLATRLRKLNDKQQGINQFVALVTRQGEERLAEMMHEGRGLWNDIATRHGIDIENVQWNLDKDGETITPVGMKL